MKIANFLLSFAVVALLAAPGTLQAQSAQGTAKALRVDGSVLLIKADGSERALRNGDVLRQGDTVQSERNGTALLVFSNGSTVRLQRNSKLSMDQLLQDPFDRSKGTYENLQGDPSPSKTLLNLDYGSISGNVKNLDTRSSFDINTAAGSAAIRGTFFTITVERTETGQIVLRVTNAQGTVLVQPPDSATYQNVPAGTEIVITVEEVVDDTPPVPTDMDGDGDIDEDDQQRQEEQQQQQQQQQQPQRRVVASVQSNTLSEAQVREIFETVQQDVSAPAEVPDPVRESVRDTIDETAPEEVDVDIISNAGGESGTP